MSKVSWFAGVGLCALALALPATAHHDGPITRQGDIAAGHAWTEAISEASHSTSVYLTIDNEGDAPDRLLAAAVPFADEVVLQAPVLDPASGSLEVKTLESIQINPGQTLTFQPGAISIQLIGVKRFFVPGEHFDMELTFARAGTFAVEVEVEPADDHEDEPPATTN